MIESDEDVGKFNKDIIDVNDDEVYILLNIKYGRGTNIKLRADATILTINNR